MNSSHCESGLFCYCNLGVSVECVSQCLQYPKAYVVMK